MALGATATVRVTELNGVLPVFKPEGPTSHDVVALARRVLRLRRIGHAGTLDPFAGGLLLLCLGKATRLAEYLTPLRKIYRGTVRLGATTDTDDLTGETIAESDAWRELGVHDVESVLTALVGEQDQLPPSYSAKKVRGKRAYAIARAGGAPKLAAVRITIHRLETLNIDLPHIEFEIECSSGTYIRSIARDIGATLGVGGHLVRLTRTAIGEFRMESALRLTRSTTEAEVRAAILGPESAVAHLPRLDLGPDALEPIGRGQPLPCQGQPRQAPVAVFVGGRLAAIGEVSGGRVWPKKVLTA